MDPSVNGVWQQDVARILGYDLISLLLNQGLDVSAVMKSNLDFSSLVTLGAFVQANVLYASWSLVSSVELWVLVCWMK